MTDIYKKSELAVLIKRHGFTLTKSIGQNFLADRNIIRKITDSLFTETENGSDNICSDHIVEIGPGAGALTKELTERMELEISSGERGNISDCRLTAIEIDRNVIPLLREVLNIPPSDGVGNHIKDSRVKIHIINDDFMNVDLARITDNRPYRIIGNLPYYITTPIIMKILEEGPAPETMVFMIQKEVAQRLAAKPGTKDYGSITVAVRYYCRVEYLFTVSKEVFIPKPNVDSAVIRLTPYVKLPVTVKDEQILFRIIRAGFGQRRKTLNNSLSQLNELNKTQIKTALENAGIDPRRRAETLDITEFARLADSVTALLRNDSGLPKV